MSRAVSIVSRLVIQLEVSEQLLLPFDQVRQANVHMFARRAGIKVKTRTEIKDGVKMLSVRRVAMATSFMSDESKARREADLKKMRARYLKRNRGGRPRRIKTIEEPPELPVVKAISVVTRSSITTKDIPATFAGSIAAFLREPRRIKRVA